MHSRVVLLYAYIYQARRCPLFVSNKKLQELAKKNTTHLSNLSLQEVKERSPTTLHLPILCQESYR